MRPSAHLPLITAGLLAAAMPQGVSAQTQPDAGALQQQIERERQQQLPGRIAPDKPVAPAAMKAAAGVVVTVKQFRFVGNTLMTSEQLAPVVADYLNRPLDFAQLNAAAAAVADVYRAAGWVVRAYLPQQDIKDDVVTLNIVEAVFGKLKLEGTLSKRVGVRQIDAIFTAQQKPGDALNADTLDRALLLADDLPGVAVAGTLAVGSNERETDLILKLADEPIFVGEAAIDNSGSRSTGESRLTANLNITSPTGMGDLLSSNLIHTQGSDYLRLGYTLPVGNDGWRIGGNVSHLRYELIGADFAALQGRGTSDSAGLEASYPLIRSRLTNLFLNLNYDHKRFDNQSLGATTTRYTIDATAIGLNGNLFDNWGGGGANSAGMVYVTGSRDNDIGTTNQQFSKLKFNLSRQQVITNNVSFFAALSGQESSDRLDSSEKFYLGGVSGIRAYPANEGSGASGVLANFELRWKLPEGVVLTGFHDAGHIRNNDGSASYSLKGSGLSVGWQMPVGVNLKATWARRQGDNPNPSATGKDQDGSLDMNRFWLSASLPF